MVDLPAGDWISLREAAKIIGCTKRAALNYIGAGLITASKIDGFWVVQRKDVERFEQPKRGRPPKPDPPPPEPAARKRRGAK